MTQMLLFDSATQPKSTTVAVTAPTVKDEPQNIAAAVEQDGGLNHMGDLARLVLLRYELVAKRRAAMAARKAQKGS